MQKVFKLKVMCAVLVLLIGIFSGFLFPAGATSQSVGLQISKWTLDESQGYICAISQNSNKLLMIRSADLQTEAVFDIVSPYDLVVADGKIYVSTTNNNQIAVFDIASKQFEKYLVAPHYAFSMAIDGDRLFYSNLERVYIYHLTTGIEEQAGSDDLYYSLYGIDDICLDRQNQILYMGQMGSSGCNMKAVRTTDFTQLSVTNYDNGYGFESCSGEIITDGSGVYYTTLNGTVRLNANNLAEIYGTYPGNVLYVKGNYVFSAKVVYERDLFAKITDLPMTVNNVLMDNANYVYLFDPATLTISKQILDLNLDQTMRHQNSGRKLILDETLNDWVYDQNTNHFYAISSDYNKLLYIRASDLMVEAEKYIGSIPSNIALSNGKLYIALHGATRIAVTGTDPESPVSMISTLYNPFRVDAGAEKIYYSEGKSFCRVVVYDPTTQQTQLIGNQNGQYCWPDVLYNPMNALFYIGEYESTGGALLAYRSSDFVQVGQNSFNHPFGKIVLDPNSLYYAGWRLDPNNLSNPLGRYGTEVGNHVIATSGTDVFIQNAVYNRDTFQKICALPITTELAAESGDGAVYLYDNAQKTITKYDNLEQVYIPESITLDSYSYLLEVNKIHITNAYAHFVDRDLKISSEAVYQFSDPEVATVNSYGWVTGLKPGTTTMTVTYGGKTATAQIRVVPPLQNIQFNPANYTISQGSTGQMSLTAYFTDGTTADVTNIATYQVYSPSIASVSAAGLLTGIKSGATVVTATYNANFAFAQVTVVPVLTALVPDSTGYSIAAGYSHNTSVTAQYSDGTNVNITNSATYQISDPSVASVNASGVVRGLKAGTATLTIAYGGKTVNVAITVLPPVVTSLSLFPSSLDVPLGTVRSIRVNAYWSDGSSSDVTSLASYQITDPQIASITSPGLVRGVALGCTTLTAIYQGKTGAAQIIVGPPVFDHLILDSSYYTLKVGATHQTIVTAYLSDGSTTDISSSAAYSLSNPQVASVDSSGRVTGISPGGVTLTVSYQGYTVYVEIIVEVNQFRFFEDFESGSFSTNGWVNSGCQMQSTVNYSGTYASRFNSTANLTKSLSTSGYTNIKVTYARTTQSFKTTQHFYVEWYNGSSWILLEDVKGNSGWAVVSWTLPSGSANNQGFKIRFRTNVSSTNYAYLDNVEITGVGM